MCVCVRVCLCVCVSMCVCVYMCVCLQQPPGLEGVSPSEEGTDLEDNEEEDLGVLDDQRSIILHLLSQLKLGMDLTRVTVLCWRTS